MDSNLKRTSIVIAVLLFITVIGAVVLMNLNLIRKPVQKETSATTSEISEIETEPLKEELNGFVQIGKNPDAWKTDEGFFDSEEISYAAILFQRMKTLGVSAVSVNGKVRVHVVDFEGNPFREALLQVKLKDKETGAEKLYTDEDKNGSINIEDLPPGKYEVWLEPFEEYIVPEKPVDVLVDDEVEYLMIDDISYLIERYSEDCFAKEDKMELSALDNADKKQNSAYPKNERFTYGIDISSQNGEIDWSKVYASGIRYVMLRAGFRGAEDGKIYADSRFYDNAKGAIKAGLDVGAYFFSQATEEAEAVEEASALLMLCSDLTITFPLTIRFDRAGGMGRADEISSEARSLVAEAFCETVKNMGYTPCIYISAKWIETNLSEELLSKYNLWIADYKELPTYEGWYDMWQFSSMGKVDGVSGEVSLSLIYND